MRKRDHNYALARHLRRNLTLPEGLLWRELKGGRAGLKFRKQHPLGSYALDFYCAQAKTGIEIDGIVHDMGDNPARDAVRDAYIAGQGIGVLRVPASVVLADPVATAEGIAAHCREAIMARRR